MAYKSPQDIAAYAVEAGVKKTSMPLKSMLLLGFLGGAYISAGYLLSVRVTASLPSEWGTFGSFLGAAVFPLGLILILIAGGELLTGNMMAVPMACLTGRVRWSRLVHNWFWITLSNFAGALFVAYFFGHLAELTTGGVFLEKVVATAGQKLDVHFWPALVSAIGCNWLVGLAVWLSYGADDIGGKIAAIWFPIMAFVAIGFQHVVANMFIIPVAIFEGYYSWGEYLGNFIPVFLGNAIGGAVLVAAVYWQSYQGDLQSVSEAGKRETKDIQG
ncbi:formate/nitrite transporter family protein [Pradoshia sp.]